LILHNFARFLIQVSNAFYCLVVMLRRTFCRRAATGRLPLWWEVLKKLVNRALQLLYVLVRISGPATMRIESPEKLSSDNAFAKRNTTPAPIVVLGSAPHSGNVLLTIHRCSFLLRGLDCPPKK